MSGLLLIDRKGTRVRAVCREHGHVGRGCPKCKADRQWSKRRYLQIKALQEWLRSVDRVDQAV